MDDEGRVPVAAEQAAALFRAQRERDEEIHRRRLHLLVSPDPSEMPPWPPCPACSAGAESVVGNLCGRPLSTEGELMLLLDVGPCGHLLIAAPCGEDVFDA
jgi:hypothetical protein